MARRRRLLGVVLAVVGCGRPGPEAKPPVSQGPGPFAPPSQLTARLRESIHVDLSWQDNATHEAGYFVEGFYAGQGPDSQEFSVIDVLPPDATTFAHEKLLPETRFVYRVRPFFGKASNVAEVTTGRKGPPQMQAATSDPPPATVQASIRSTESEALAAPADLRATLLPPAGIRLEWKDHARDEDQYLIEIRSDPAGGFRVSSFEPADTRTWTSYDFDAETTFAFRVRAFIYGEPSNVVETKTGPDPSMGAGEWKRVQ